MTHPLFASGSLLAAGGAPLSVVPGRLFSVEDSEPKSSPVRRPSRRKKGASKEDYSPGMRPAGVLIRVGARMIDGAIFWVIVFLLGLALAAVGISPESLEGLFLSGVQIAAVALYETLLTSSSWQGTIGKRVLEIKVVRGNGERLSFGHSLGRYAAYFLVLTVIELLIGLAAVYVFAGLAFLLPALVLVGFSFLPRKRLPHDLLASTSVDVVRFSSLLYKLRGARARLDD